jgi:hypothetical protein
VTSGEEADETGIIVPVNLSDPNTPVHSSNGRLLVTRVEPRS